MTIVVWVGNAPLCSFIWTLDPQLVAIIGYILEPLGDFPNWGKYDIEVGLWDFFFFKESPCCFSVCFLWQAKDMIAHLLVPVAMPTYRGGLWL